MRARGFSVIDYIAINEDINDRILEFKDVRVKLDHLLLRMRSQRMKKKKMNWRLRWSMKV